MSVTSTHWPIPTRGEAPDLETDAPPDSELPVKRGDVISGRYAVHRILATGGMGVVCLGRHVDLDQPVAIKFLRRELMQNPAIVQRFLNEARAAASLRSEHVVRVIDVAELESGRPYLVMEHLDGEDLGALVDRQGPLEASRALGYVLDVCAALGEAHAAGIVHRDIKPENLILCAGSGRDIVKVVDFGLAKRIDASRAVVVTDPREGMGSPCYMSPEQIATPHAVDARTDIWSLGVVIYRLVTGILPFDGDSVSEVCARVLNASPRPLSYERPELGPLDAIVRRCLEKDRERRYRSVDQLADAIRLYRAAALYDTQPTSRPPDVVPMSPPSEAPMALGPAVDSPSRFIGPFVASLVAFVVAGAALGSYAAGGVDRLRELAGAAVPEVGVPSDPPDVASHPTRQLAVVATAPGVCAASPVALRGGGVALPAERERARRHDDEDEGTKDADAPSDKPPKDEAVPADARASDTKESAAHADDETVLDAAEIARRERRYRRYLDRHGYKPIREVLEQIERSSGSPPDGAGTAQPKP